MGVLVSGMSLSYAGWDTSCHHEWQSRESMGARCFDDDPEISLIFAHGVGSLKELWDVPCPSRGGVVLTHSAREALRALLLDVVSIQ